MAIGELIYFYDEALDKFVPVTAANPLPITLADGGGGLSEAEVQALIDADIAALVDTAPGTLDTLNELAAALGDDANFATTVTNSLAAKAPLTKAIVADTGVAYTPVLTDAGKVVTLDDAAAIALTLPQDSDVAFPVGTEITFLQIGAGQVTASAGTGATLNSPGPTNKFRAQYSAVTAFKRAANTWVIMGDLAAS